MSHACVGMRSRFPLLSSMPTQAWDMAPVYLFNQQELLKIKRRGLPFYAFPRHFPPPLENWARLG
jgi:hypothetical protein